MTNSPLFWYDDIRGVEIIEKIWLDEFAKNSKRAGIVMMILGIAGFLMPKFFTLTLSYLVGWLLLFAAFTQAYSAYEHKHRHVVSWLRLFLNLVASLIFLLSTNVGAALLGCCLLFTFLLMPMPALLWGSSLKSMATLSGVLSMQFFRLGWE